MFLVSEPYFQNHWSKIQPLLFIHLTIFFLSAFDCGIGILQISICGPCLFVSYVCEQYRNQAKRVTLNVKNAKKGKIVESWYGIVRNGFLEDLTFKKRTEGLSYRNYFVENQIEGKAHVNDLWWYSLFCLFNSACPGVFSSRNLMKPHLLCLPLKKNPIHMLLLYNPLS